MNAAALAGGVKLTRAFYWQQLLDDGLVGSYCEIAWREGLDARATRRSRLSLDTGQ